MSQEDIKEYVYVYVMDYSTSTISKLTLNAKENVDIENMLEKHGFNINTCSWMITTNNIDSIELIDNISYAKT